MTTQTQTYRPLTPGTAKITASAGYRRPSDALIYTVLWINSGSFLRNEPRAFLTDSEARDFCRERGLRVVVA